MADRNVNPFGVFLERRQQADIRRQSATRSASAQQDEGDATKTVLHALQELEVVDPASLGLDFVELGRALERLQNLQAIELTTQNGRQVARRAAKFDDVRFLLNLK